jgi:hypothetical protein
VSDNGGNGISTDAFSSIRGNTINNNGGYGLVAGTPSAYGDNVFYSSTGDNVSTSPNTPVDVGGNMCQASSVPCP